MIEFHQSVESTPSSGAEFLERLFSHSDEYLERDPFATIGEATHFYTKAVGVTFAGRQDIIAGLAPDAELELRRDVANPIDPYAIAVYHGALPIGYLRRQIARRIAPNMDSGARYLAAIGSLTGGNGRSLGVNLYVRRERERRERAAPLGTTAVSPDTVLHALIGDQKLRPAQRSVIDRVEAGRNTLAVLGTGQGKSLCFQFPAAVNALAAGRKTVVLYPLRALANDQYVALVRRLEPLGLRILRANGAIDMDERAALMDALDTGSWDIICSTPEFFGYHLDRFDTELSRPHLIVVDEAHHVFESKHRPAYGRIGAAIERLGSPQVLALTATASDDCFAAIVESLKIQAWVIDPTVRSNLSVVDARGTRQKVAYILSRATAQGKSIVFCNSRNEAAKVAERLRVSIPNVAFYHAGVPSPERAEIERMFRESELRVVVATSAFGEGIDLPDVRNVFLYHMNFDVTEFNQQAGRAGRDGAPAEIHLLFGDWDRNINDFILERQAPTLSTLRELYREMKRLTITDTLRMTYADIAATLDMNKVDGSTIGAAVRIFEEASLLRMETDDDGRLLTFLPAQGRIDFAQVSSRFAEGEAEREIFAHFCRLVLSTQADVLENVINRPIYPSAVPLIQ